MHTIHWNIDSLDWQLKNRELIKEEIVKYAHDGAIVLLHDIYRESVEGALLAMAELEKEVQVSHWCKVDEHHTAVRFCTSWATTEENIDRVISLL